MKKNVAFITAIALLASAGIAQAVPLVPPNFVKWSQSPDMDRGTDYLSMHRTNGPIVADDFRSDGRPISGFHWWGSYLTIPGTNQEWETGQVPDPSLTRNVSFEISIHQDCPIRDPNCGNGGPYPYSTPRDGNYFSAIVQAEEIFFGTTAGGENVYEYWLSVENLRGPDFWRGTWNEVAGEIYWVDFGWDAGQFGTDINSNIWGWHESFEHNLDFAVQTNPPSPGGNPHLGPWAMLDGKDMAFEVLTAVPVPAALWLFGTGLLGLIAVARRKQA